MMHRVRVTSIAGWVFGVCLLITGQALAQVSDVRLEVPRENLGLAGQARLGAWTPIRLSLENMSSEPRQVVCRWLLNDADGDRVMAQRRVTLDALTTQDAWVYGPLPMRADPSDPWTLQVLNEDASAELARTESLSPRSHSPSQRLIGILGTTDMGLNSYTYQATFHEVPTLVTGLSLPTLPDRWYGLSAVDTLVWSRTGGDPDDPLLSSSTQQALRQWVRRGGHLVIVMPAFGETWTGSSLSDLLPIKGNQMYRAEATPPGWLGPLPPDEVMKIDITTFNVSPGDGVDVIKSYTDENKITRPVVIAKRFGSGRVTLVGFDFADSRFAQMGLPSGRYPIWNDIFNWQSPVFSESLTKSYIDNATISRPTTRSDVPLDRFIAGQVSMRSTAAAALLAAILLFGVYWLLAGPLSFFVLKNRNAARHSWLAFVLIVLGFTAISWAGAWLFAPSNAAVSHFTVLTAHAGSPNVHAHSWLSVYVPSFTEQAITLGPDQPNARNTLASPGMTTDGSGTGFVDPQTYTLDAANPNAAVIPFRSTAKQLEADYLGRIDQVQTGLSEPFVLPQGELTIRNAFPAGTLTHGLPGPLTNVRVIYCPGENQDPKTWHYPTWEPRTPLDLNQRDRFDSLVMRMKLGPMNYSQNDKSERPVRNFKTEGFLGKVIDSRPGQKLIDAAGTENFVTTSDSIQYIELLSFFDTLPPPDFQRMDFRGSFNYQRELAHQLDLTHLLSGHRLIIMGHLNDSPLPVPLTVDEQELPSNGWTVVRWVYDFK